MIPGHGKLTKSQSTNKTLPLKRPLQLLAITALPHGGSPRKTFLTDDLRNTVFEIFVMLLGMHWMPALSLHAAEAPTEL